MAKEGEEMGDFDAPWTAEEQDRFQKALNEISPDDTSDQWASLAVVVGRPVESVKRHASRYFLRLQSELSASSYAGLAEKGAAEAELWTQRDDKLFEVALSEVEDDKDRWTNIASRVPGKSARACMLRYQKLLIHLARIDAGEEVFVFNKSEDSCKAETSDGGGSVMLDKRKASPDGSKSAEYASPSQQSPNAPSLGGGGVSGQLPESPRQGTRSVNSHPPSTERRRRKDDRDVRETRHSSRERRSTRSDREKDRSRDRDRERSRGDGERDRDWEVERERRSRGRDNFHRERDRDRDRESRTRASAGGDKGGGSSRGVVRKREDYDTS